MGNIKNKKIYLVDKFKCVAYSGGIERVICNFANEFVRRGYDVSIICLDTDAGVPFYHLDKRVKFVNLAFAGKQYCSMQYYIKKGKREVLRAVLGRGMAFNGVKIKDPIIRYFETEFIKRLQNLIAKERPDCIIGTSVSAANFITQACKRADTDIPIITQIHTAPWAETKEIITADEKEALIHSAYVQVLMDEYKKYFYNMGCHNVICIPNIVEQVEEDKVVDLSVNKEKYTVIDVARMEKNVKRPHQLVEAFVKISNMFPEWQLEFYGAFDEGSYIRGIRKFIKDHNCQDRIFLKGQVQDIQKRMQKADIFVLPSSYEGFGLALAEAMSLGLPAIGYKSCAAVNTLIINGKNVFLCNDGVDALAGKLEQLMSEQELRVQMGREAHNSMKLYEPQKIWDRWEKILLSIF